MINYSIKTWFLVLLEHGFAFLATIASYNMFLIDLNSYRFAGHGRCPIGACNKTSQTNAVSGSIPIDRSFRKPYVTCNVNPGLINHGLSIRGVTPPIVII